MNCQARFEKYLDRGLIEPRSKQQIAARDECPYIGKAERGPHRAQIGHRQFAGPRDVDGAE